MTTTAVPSKMPEDFALNIENLDKFTNSTSATFTDRLGVVKKTITGVLAEYPNASGNAADAAISAGDAQTQANIAMVQAGISTAQAGLAATAKTQAEAARDASLIQAGVYVDEPTGRAAVADGMAFKVQGSGDVAAYEYRRTSSTDAVLIATYPSKSAVDALGQVFDNTAFTFQGYVSNGVYFANALYRATDFLRVEGGASYAVTAAVQGTLTHDWFDTNKAYISSFTSPSTSAISTVTATAPANARYLMVSSTAAGATYPTAGVRSVSPALNIDKVLKIVADNPRTLASQLVTYEAETVKTRLDSLSATQLVVKDRDVLTQVFKNTAFTFQGYVTNGVYFANALYRATDYLNVEENVSYQVTAAIQGTLTHDWYDANKVFISSFVPTTFYVVATVTATAPAGARYLRASSTNVGAADITAGVRSVVPGLNIANVLKIVKDNPPTLPSTSINHGTGTVKSKLDSFDASQTFILSQQATMLANLDILGDANASLFVNTWGYTKSAYGTTSNTPIEVPILSRVSNDTFTVDPANSAHLSVAEGSIIIKDSALNRYASYGVKSNAGGTVVIYGTLPASISAAQAMHDTNLGQHLSRMGYKGLADFIVEQSQKYGYKKKKPIFYYHPPASGAPVWNDPNIYNMAGTVKLINVSLLGGAGNGGFVAGTNNSLLRTCGPDNADTNLTYSILTKFLPRGYSIASAGAGDGVEIKFTPYGIAGFIDLPVSASCTTYDTDKITVGRVRVQVIGDGVTSFHDAIYDAGAINYLKIPFANAQEIAIRITLADSVPSIVCLHGIYAYAKSVETPTTGFFVSGDVVGFLGDSWTQFPPKTGAEVLPLRPDGSTGDGMQFLSVRLKERLAQDGIDVTTMNMGQGGRTSAWGRQWVGKMAELTPRLTHCVICFYVNDSNSPVFPVDSSYTIDPNNMWGGLNVSSGGIKGVVTDAEWFANLEYICTRLLKAGIKPIVLMPSHTASPSQAQNLQQKFLSKIAAGFNTVNADGGRV